MTDEKEAGKPIRNPFVIALRESAATRTQHFEESRAKDDEVKKPSGSWFSGAVGEMLLFAAIMIPVMVFAPWLLIVLVVGYFIFAAFTGKEGKGPGQYGRYDGDGG